MSAGLDKWIVRRGDGQRRRPTFHTLRHSFAQTADAGIDEATIMALGGWRSRAMLERYKISSAAAKQAALAKHAEYLKAERAKAPPVDLLDAMKRESET